MLQRKGRRVKAGLEEDALERSVSQPVSISFAASLQFIVFERASARVIVPTSCVYSVCFIARANILDFFKQTR